MDNNHLAGKRDFVGNEIDEYLNAPPTFLNAQPTLKDWLKPSAKEPIMLDHDNDKNFVAASSYFYDDRSVELRIAYRGLAFWAVFTASCLIISWLNGRFGM